MAIMVFALGAVRATGTLRVPSLMNRVGTVALRCTPLAGLPLIHRLYQGRESLAMAMRSQPFSAAQLTISSASDRLPMTKAVSTCKPSCRSRRSN